MVDRRQDIFDWEEDHRQDSNHNIYLSLGRQSQKKNDFFFFEDMEESVPNQKNTFSIENKLQYSENESDHLSPLRFISCPKMNQESIQGEELSKNRPLLENMSQNSQQQSQEEDQYSRQQKIKETRIRQAEKLGSSYYNQELRNIIKKHFKYSKAYKQMRQFTKCNKSRKYFFLMIHHLNKKQIKKFLPLLKESLAGRIKKQQEKRDQAGHQYFLMEIKNQFQTIYEAAQIFFKGDYQAAIRHAFVRRRDKVHSTTRKGIKEAINVYETLLKEKNRSEKNINKDIPSVPSETFHKEETIS